MNLQLIQPSQTTFSFQSAKAPSSPALDAILLSAGNFNAGSFNTGNLGEIDLASPDAKVQIAASAVSAGSSQTSSQYPSDFRTALLDHLKESARDVKKNKDKAHEAAQQFVSTALVLPMLKQMRDTTFKSDLFHGGQGEDAFGPQLDQILSDRIVQRMSTPQKISASGSVTQGMGLVDAVYKQIIRSNEHHSTRSMKHIGQSNTQAPTRVDLQG